MKIASDADGEHPGIEDRLDAGLRVLDPGAAVEGNADVFRGAEEYLGIRFSLDHISRVHHVVHEGLDSEPANNLPDVVADRCDR